MEQPIPSIEVSIDYTYLTDLQKDIILTLGEYELNRFDDNIIEKAEEDFNLIILFNPENPYSIIVKYYPKRMYFIEEFFKDNKTGNIDKKLRSNIATNKIWNDIHKHFYDELLPYYDMVDVIDAYHLNEETTCYIFELVFKYIN